jgi:hypothetical protein
VGTGGEGQQSRPTRSSSELLNEPIDIHENKNESCATERAHKCDISTNISNKMAVVLIYETSTTTMKFNLRVGNTVW